MKNKPLLIAFTACLSFTSCNKSPTGASAQDDKGNSQPKQEDKGNSQPKQEDTSKLQAELENRRKIQELEAQLQQIKQKNDLTLTREKALQLIRLEPVYEAMDLRVLHEEHDQYHGPFDYFVLEAEKDGLLLTRDVGKNEPKYYGVAKNVSITQKGLTYLTKKNGQDFYRMADLKPIEITSIGAPSQFGGKTVSRVNFKFLNEPTPFGVAFDRAAKSNLHTGWAPAMATFVQYDDGWHFEGWEPTR